MVKKIFVPLIIVAALAVAAYFILRPPDEKQIIAGRLRQLAATVSKKNNEGPLGMAVKHQTISGFIDRQCKIYIKEAMLVGDFSPEEFASQMSRARTRFKYLDGQIGECEVQLADDEGNATVEFDIRVIAETKTGKKFDEVRDLRAKVKKNDGKWLFSAFEIRQVMEK